VQDRLSPFGRLLRQWRALRGVSQLGLAVEAGTSTRHLSFVETGRSKPSREMVLRLAEALDVPLRERNALLAAAGFASIYRERDLEAPELEPLRRVLAFLLERQDPYPAFLVDRCFRVLRANRAAAQSLALFSRDAPVWREEPLNLLTLTLHPDGLRPHLVNWDAVASALVGRLQRAAALAGSDAELARLLETTLALPGLPESCRAPDPSLPLPPFLPMQLKFGELELRLFSTLTTIGTPQDVTLQELHIESLMPADEASDAALRALASQAPAPAGARSEA
jgi:transcriptional regulator with XRE-family HTH domain